MRRTAATIAILVLLASACSSGLGEPGESAPAAGVAVTDAPATTSGPPDGTPHAAPSLVARLPQAGRNLLVVASADTDGLQVISANTGEVLAPMPQGVPATAWTRLLTATPRDGGTVVAAFTVENVENPASLTLDGSWRLPTIGDDPQPVGLSGNASILVLVDGSAAPANPPVSRFAVMPASLQGKPRIISLHGSFDFDAVSTDGRSLYIVEHLAAPPAGHYQVRQVDVSSGRLQPGVVVDKTNLGEAMAGWPLGQVRLADGRVLTLYRGAEHPFIHALDTVQAFAVCIDLPAAGAGDPGAARDWGIAEADTGLVYGVNVALGLVVEVDPGAMQLRRTATVAPMAANGVVLAKLGNGVGGPAGRRAIVAPGGGTLFAAGSAGILAISTSTLKATWHWREGQAVDGLALSGDGAMLFALLHGAGRIAVIDTATGLTVGMVPGSGYNRLAAVLQGD